MVILNKDQLGGLRCTEQRPSGSRS
jgi:hypothetical protein